MVGVGEGVPDAGVQLEDVVVSKPSREFGGVIQYDCGKIISGGIWEHTGMLNKPPTVLLTATSRLQAAHRQRPSQVPGIISKALARNSMMVTTFGYPDTSDGTLGEQKLTAPETSLQDPLRLDCLGQQGHKRRGTQG